MLEVKGHRVIVLVDRSGSMDTADCEGNQTRYNYLREKLAAFVTGATQSSHDGKVTLIFFANKADTFEVQTADQVNDYMKKHIPGGGTATHWALEQAWREYQRDPKVPAMVFLVTDGQPDSEPAVDKEIIEITQRIKKDTGKPELFRIMLLTVGERSAHITQWLQHLDDDLGPSGAAYDIVGQNDLNQVDFQEAAAELIGSTTTDTEAASGQTAGKTTHRID